MNIESIWIERSIVKDGKRVPTFWHPTRLPELDNDSVDLPLMSRLVAIGLTLELPVGELVSSQMRRIPGLNVGIIEKVLKAQISDEARHNRGMEFARDYLVKRRYTPDVETVTGLVKELEGLPYSPITIAGLLEVTLFFPFLALMRLRGGQAFNRLALGINEDEQRHVRVNCSLASAIGEPIPTCVRFLSIRDSILDFALESSQDRDLVYKASNELFNQLDSDTLNQLRQVAALQWKKPFEVHNSTMYARTTSDLIPSD